MATIGKSARVKGRVHGNEDLTVEGRVEGEVAIDGDVIIEASGLVAANISAHVITVRGAIKGDLTGSEAVRLEDGARVVGDLRAPRVAIAPGALVRGYVQTAHNGKVEAPARRPAAAVAARPVARPTPPARVAAPPPRAPQPVQKPAAKAEPKRASITIAGGIKAPPPPVVPVLKKGSKGALKKKG
jgi:cytoskeletal protein CcmA (bactofilin family)